MAPGDNNANQEAQQPPLQNENNDQQNTPRVPRTHTSPVVIKLLKALPLISILQKNKQIEEQNNARSLKTLNHHLDPDAFPDPGSEEASLISIDPEDHERLKVPSFWASLRDHIYPTLAKSLADEEIRDREAVDSVTSLKRKAGDEKSASSAADVAAGKRRCMDGSKLTAYEAGIKWNRTFPQILYDTEDCDRLPLTCFVNKNLRILVAEASTLPTIKSNPKPGEAKGIFILDIAKLTARFGSELSMDFSQWSEAAENAYQFQQERDKDGPQGAHAGWYASHFGFFHSLEKKVELYEHWKGDELKFRQEHWSTYGSFAPHRYELAYALAEKHSETMAEVRETVAVEVARAPFARDARSFNSKPPPRAHPPNRSYSSPSSFPSGSGKPSSSTADCLICGERGHDARTHNNTTAKFKDGNPAWAKYSNQALLTPDNHTLCINWNIRGERSHPCSHGAARVHLCSFCGSKAHHAFSWSCRPAPSSS